MIPVELSIQLQIRDIAAVKQAFAAAVAGRNPNTLWRLVDDTNDIPYENRVKGSNLTTIDTNVQNVNISSLFSDWFNLQNSYFSQDNPISGVQSLKPAIETVYRWRVPQEFNIIASGASGQPISFQYTFPSPTFNLGTYAATGPAAGTFTKGVGPVDMVTVGPGILGVLIPTAGKTGAVVLTLSLTAVYPDGTSGVVQAVVPANSVPGYSAAFLGSALTAAYTAPAGNGVVTVTQTTGFKVNNLAVIAENKGDGFTWVTEVVEVVAIGTNQLTLRQPTVPGAANPFPSGLRNSYTTTAVVYPLFTDVTAVTNSTGTSGDSVQLTFYPDWAQGYVNILAVAPILAAESESYEEAESEPSEEAEFEPSEEAEA